MNLSRLAFKYVINLSFILMDSFMASIRMSHILWSEVEGLGSELGSLDGGSYKFFPRRFDYPSGIGSVEIFIVDGCN